MKINVFLILVAFLFFSCKNEKAEPIDQKPLTVAEKIAKAHGIDHWNAVEQLEFTFNVDRDTSHFERSWIWRPKTNEVTLMTASDTIQYNRLAIDSTNQRADQSFINDKFWLLVPFQLVWDSGTTISEPEKTEAPISKKTMNKITLLYPNEGGYTPGDAYDLFYNEDHVIQEWIFRKSNDSVPSLINTFENYTDVNGLKIAQDHKKEGGNYNLNFTNVRVIANN